MQTQSVPFCTRGAILCTEDCPFRSSCSLHRAPLLIHCIVIRPDRIYPDEYLNDVALLKGELVAKTTCRLRGGKRLSHTGGQNLELMGV